MNALVVYDSAYGNTAEIARSIVQGLGDGAQALQVNDVTNENLNNIELLIVGSPTQGGRATKPVQDYLAALPQLGGLKVAAFDTRFAKEEHGVGLRLLMGAIGFAAEKIEHELRKNGGQIAQPCEGFIVEDTKGSLRGGETERAETWAAKMK